SVLRRTRGARYLQRARACRVGHTLSKLQGSHRPLGRARCRTPLRDGDRRDPGRFRHACGISRVPCRSPRHGRCRHAIVAASRRRRARHPRRCFLQRRRSSRGKRVGMSGAFSLEGKVALVTGGARGIGLAIVEELLGRGAQIVIADSGVSISGDQPDTKVAEQAAAKLGTRTAAFASDIASPDMADAAVKLAVEHFGALDIIVNNGAILRDAFIFKSARADWQRVIDNNLTRAWSVLAAATPVLREAVKSGRSPGRIVNIVSSAGLYGNFGQAAYAASKAGLWGLTRVVAMDMARSGVLCNAVAPFAATRVTESIQPAND